MTDKELGRYYKLQLEIQDLEERIIEFGDGVRGMQYKEVSVSSSHPNKSIQEKKMELISTWLEKRIAAIEECLKIERYINEVEDPTVRQILRLRCIDCKTWAQIDKELHYAEDSTKKIYYRWKKSVHTCPPSNEV